MIEQSLNDKYQILRKDKNPNSLFSSFRILKVIGHGGIAHNGERSPYPIIISDPKVSEVFYNLNKSDVLLGLTVVGIGFLGSIFVTRKYLLLNQKFLATQRIMYWYFIWGSIFAMTTSYYRLTGRMENGLRWKRKDLLYSKYDFTKDFEQRTIFKHMRERVD